MSNIGKNLRKIRTVKKLSQSAFADLFQLNRGMISAYEEGRAEPKLDVVLDIAKYFSISVEHLLDKNLTVNQILGFNNVLENLLQIGNQAIQIPLKMVKSELAPYLHTHNEDRNFWENLPSINEFLKSDKVFAFQMFNGDMYDGFTGIREGEILFCEPFSNWKALKNYSLCLVLLQNSTLVRNCKFKNEKFYTKALNKASKNKIYEASQIQKIFRVVGILYGKINDLSKSSDRLSELENRISVLEKKVANLVKN